MSTQKLISHLSTQGVHLEVKLKASGRKPDSSTLELLKHHKADLISHIVQKQSVTRLPWKLERLVSAAANGFLRFNLRGIPNINTYVMAWACSYLTGDQEESLQRLWHVYQQWQEEIN